MAVTSLLAETAARVSPTFKPCVKALRSDVLAKGGSETPLPESVADRPMGDIKLTAKRLAMFGAGGYAVLQDGSVNKATSNDLRP